MNNQICKLLTLLFTFSFTVRAQITFEPGYYITDQGQKVNGLIQNEDWGNNPSAFEFKTDASAKAQTKDINTVKEFGVDNVSKYIRATVDIDRSANDIANMSMDRNPAFQKETLFLDVLVEGSATLYKYKDGQLTRYFFKVKDSEISQLIYKTYLFESRKTLENKTFQQQLFNEVNCKGKTIKQLINLDYTNSDLTDYFLEQNICSNVPFVNYEIKGTKSDFNLSVRAGINFTDLVVLNPVSSSRNIEFGTSTNARFGLEAEWLLPFNKNKWGITLEPYYESYKGDYFREGNSGPSSDFFSTIDYQSFSVPIGIRYYSFLNSNFAAFYNIGWQYHFDSNDEIINSRGNTTQGTLEIRASQSFFLGAGLKYRGRYSLEFRYNTTRDLTTNLMSISSDYKVMSLMLGYKLF